MVPIIVYAVSLLILLHRSTTCSIFSSLNCSCFQSTDDVKDSTINRTLYSHLYCQSDYFNDSILNYSSNFEDNYSKKFRTVSIEFSADDHIEILSNHFDLLGDLFVDRNSNDSIEIFLRFHQFHQIQFHPQSITSNMFGDKHQKKYLSLDFIPTRSNRKQTFNPLSSSSDDQIDQLYLSPNCFSNLNLTEMKISIFTQDEQTSKNSSFEEIFNNTSIDQLHFFGSILLPSNSSHIRNSFLGSIRELTLHRRVDTIDAKTFPFYSTVLSYTIDSIGAHSMNLKSFVPLYENLRHLEIIEPRFDIEINEFIPSLESLTVDVENFHSKTLFAARHIQKLKFGSRLRRFDPTILSSPMLFRRLQFLDFSSVHLSQLTIESRCFLLEYLQKNFRSQFKFLFPKIENSSECQCEELYLLHLIYPTTDFQHSTCSKLCQFNQCSFVREYFQKIYLSNPTLNDNIPIIDLSLDSFDENFFPFVHNPTEKAMINSSLDNDYLDVSTLESFQTYIENYTTIYIYSFGLGRSKPKKESMSWIWFMCLFIFAFVFLFVFVLVILMIRSRRRKRSKSLPVQI